MTMPRNALVWSRLPRHLRLSASRPPTVVISGPRTAPAWNAAITRASSRRGPPRSSPVRRKTVSMCVSRTFASNGGAP